MSQGGSRYGAGRPGWHAKTTAASRLDVREMQRQGAFKQPGGSFTLTWESGGTVRLSVEPDAVALSYRYKSGDDWHEVAQRVSLERTPCHYGGARLWFRCPRCCGRVAVLYLRGWPACRKCARLVYPSQSMDAIDRSWRRQWAIERKLSGGAKEWNFRKLKGMRLATFARLRENYWREEEVRDEALAMFVARMGWQL